jgi:hypothetical protein
VAAAASQATISAPSLIVRKKFMARRLTPKVQIEKG